MSTDKSAAAVREFAEKWCLRVIECMKDDDYIMHDPEGILSDLTALISEGYVEKAKYDEAVRQRDELREALKELVHLHGCEQEGLLSGQPTPEQWYKAVEKAELIITKAEAK